MKNDIHIPVPPDMIIAAVKAMEKNDRDEFLEDLLAATSPDFLESIKESRADYAAGRVLDHSQVFGQ